MPPTSRNGRADRALSVAAVVIGVALALLLLRVMPARAAVEPREGAGIVVVGPLGLRTMAVPASK